MCRIEVKAMPKHGILDPQSNAVKKSLHRLGFDEVRDVRVAKHIDLFFEREEDFTYKRVEEMCKKLLVNEVIEDYEVTICIDEE